MIIGKKKKILLTKDKFIKKINLKFKKKGSLSYPFSHFNLSAEIFYAEINKKKFPDQKWLNLSKYNSSQLPTVMKKIVNQAI